MSFNDVRFATFVREIATGRMILVDAIGLDRQHIIGHYVTGDQHARIHFSLDSLKG